MMKEKEIKYHNVKINSLFRLVDNLIILLVIYWVSFFLFDKQNDSIYGLFLLFIIFYNYLADSQHANHSLSDGSFFDGALSIIISWFVALLFISLINIFFVHVTGFSSSFWLAFLIIIPVFIVLFHIFIRLLLEYASLKGLNTRKSIIYGATPLGVNLSVAFKKMPSSGAVFEGFYDDRQDVVDERREKVELRGMMDDLFKECYLGKVERVYITLSMAAAETRIKYIVKKLADTTVSVYVAPDIFTYDLLHSRIKNYRGIPVVSIYDTPFFGVDSFVKRVEDIVLSVIILTIILIPMLIIAIGVKISSPGPVLFKQNRYGRGGGIIAVWKFRSMNIMEDKYDVVQATKNDSRTTSFGRFIRRTSLDELPQFINVLQGTMSIVGPRPHAVSHNEEYRKMILGYMLRHKVKPGITGLAQIKGFRGETDTLDKMKKRVDFDLVYIRKWSIFLDLKIIFLTIFRGFMHKNAY